jgi:predicted GNAT family acetyltransferase
LDITVHAAPERNRYEISADGKPAGFTEYAGPGSRQAAPGEIAFLHTEIDPAFGGQGLGGRLITFVLDDARKQGLAVIPYCPFVRSYIAKHPEYLDLVPADRRGEFEL